MTLARSIHAWLDELATGYDPVAGAASTLPPDSLVSSSSVTSFVIGTGTDIFSLLQPELETAEEEIIFVTCFWAKSSSLRKLCDSLKALSTKALQRGSKKIKVRICFSSLSLLQKLFHTRSPLGRVYPPSTWVKKLGLPKPEDLTGLDITVKSKFLLPFGVMHPKFIIIDKKIVLIPSCNVSWEPWFEGCVKLSGSIVLRFHHFWQSFWEGESQSLNTGDEESPRVVFDIRDQTPPSIGSVTSSFRIVSIDSYEPIPTILLPSGHHINPHFRPWPWQSVPPPPHTPLNTFLLHMFSKARKEIYIQTPNITSPSVLNALLDCLKGGVNVKILTNDRLMVLEQLVTAGTTTSRCIKRLIRHYEKETQSMDEETGLPGQLGVFYWQPERSPHITNDELCTAQRSHLKITIVDMEVTILGSGNMDRASWFTSQELGVALFSADFARNIWVEGILPSMIKNCRYRYTSNGFVMDPLGNNQEN
ncbi:hypothetical protein AJ80_04568 [Polytolypa hystricis UAMH7299]|uniref:PLD phosphodiesterase domain-containing protein n=1 Tax=Polytolypa hystricis (strain UAMH7299) TaxID=1447883 RepID=A0A2B7YAU7_POLH7|nr:hypothetical protein AJ80_04568 [Polytolypa hystricis UAMH7299]